MKKRKNVIDAMTIWHAKKPSFNGFMCGHGVHGDTKYNRRKVEKQIKQEKGY